MPQANLTRIQKFLGGVDYPADKQGLIKNAQREGADENVRASLEQLPDMFYANSEEVSQAIGKMSGIEVTGLNEFLAQAIQDSMVEVDLCELALRKSDRDEVRAFAQKMIDDHSTMGQEMKKLAFARGVLLPGGPGPEDRSHLERLSKLSGKEFDIDFISYNVAEHEKDIKIFSHYAEHGADARITKLAANAVDVLSQHLRMARYIEDRLKS